MSSAYSFRQFKHTDLKTVESWLSTADVSLWNPDTEYIDDLKESTEDDRIQMNLVCYNDEAFAYIQHYDTYGWEDHHLSFLQNGSRGLDIFIGKPDMIGCGHGTAYIQKLNGDMTTCCHYLFQIKYS